MINKATSSSCIDCSLKSVAAKSLSNDELLFMNSNCAEVQMHSGENIFREGSLSSHIAYLKKGLAKVHATGPDGSEQILKLVKEGAYIGLQTILADKVHQYSATSVNECTICYIDNTSFRYLIRRNPEFATSLITYLCNDELEYFKRVIALTQKQVNGRLADALIYFATIIEGNTEFILPLSREELASMAGTSRESISRALSDLRATGLIKLSGKNISILNMSILKEISKKG